MFQTYLTGASRAYLSARAERRPLAGLLYNLAGAATEKTRLDEAERALTRCGRDVDWIGDEFALARRLALGGRWGFLYAVGLQAAPATTERSLSALCELYGQRLVAADLPAQDAFRTVGLVARRSTQTGSGDAATG